MVDREAIQPGWRSRPAPVPLLLLVAVVALGGCTAPSGNPIPVPGMGSMDGPQSLEELGLTEAPRAAPAPAATSPVLPASPVARDWGFQRVESATGAAPGAPLEAGLRMEAEGGVLRGFTPCSRMRADYVLDASGGALRFENLTRTATKCDPTRAATDAAVLDVMRSTDAFRMIDGDLELLSKGKVVAHLIAK